MYLASVTLLQPILLDPTNPTFQLAAGTGGLGPGSTSARVHAAAIGGQLREYAAGRTRLVTNLSDQRSIPLVFKSLTRAQSNLLLELWPGVLLLFRDTYGTRMFGSYLATSLQHIPRSSQGDVADISLTFQRLTYTDGV